VACALTHSVAGASKSTAQLWSTATLLLIHDELPLDRFRIVEHLRDSRETGRCKALPGALRRP
jgi:hypothetical protein